MSTTTETDTEEMTKTLNENGVAASEPQTEELLDQNDVEDIQKLAESEIGAELLNRAIQPIFKGNCW